MGMVLSNTKKSTLEDLLKWVKSNKEYYVVPGVYGVESFAKYLIDYNKLVAELKKRIIEAEGD